MLYNSDYYGVSTFGDTGPRRSPHPAESQECQKVWIGSHFLSNGSKRRAWRVRPFKSYMLSEIKGTSPTFKTKASDHLFKKYGTFF